MKRSGHYSSERGLFICAIVAVIAIPLIARVVGPNPVYGFRTPRTLADENLWYSANAFAGWTLLAASVTSAVLLLLQSRLSLFERVSPGILILAPLAIALASSAVYLAGQ